MVNPEMGLASRPRCDAGTGGFDSRNFRISFLPRETAAYRQERITAPRPT